MTPGSAAAPLPKSRLEGSMSETKLPPSASSGHHPTVLGRSVVVRGELSGQEDLLLEGSVDGQISLPDHCLTIGPTGQVKAEIRARQVAIHGSVEGNVTARDKIEIRKSGRVVGDLATAAIAIEEGGYLKGSIDILREDDAPRATAARALDSDAKPREGFGLMRVRENPRIDSQG